jgi:hypothetical protein
VSLYEYEPGGGSRRPFYGDGPFSSREPKSLSANVFGYKAAAEASGIHGVVPAQPVRQGTQPASQANGTAEIVKALTPAIGSLVRFAGARFLNGPDPVQNTLNEWNRYPPIPTPTPAPATAPVPSGIFQGY